MVLRSCVRLLVRRLALRKGISLVVVCVTLLGSLSLYHQYSAPSNSGRHSVSVDIRKVTVAPPRSEAVTRKELDVSHPRGSHDRQERPMKSQEPVVIKHQKSPELRVLSEDLPECMFSSTQPTSDHVDITMSDLVDQLAFDDPLNTNGWNQGFDISYNMDDFKDQPLQVFIVPHSHNDPGWIKTFEEYYRAQTRNILNLMTDALANDKRKKFIWAEISYLDLWWTEQSPEKRNTFKRLVEAGQIEIVTGGWVMNDEANTHYFAMLDQLIEGHTWLAKNMPGVKPMSGWAIDPFGYTSTMPYLLQGTGLESMLIQRVHYAVKKQLASNQQLEFGWLQEWDTGYDTGMFCHLMPFYSYDVPHTCGPHPKVCCQFDFIRLPGGRIKCPWKVSPVVITDSNVRERAEMLLNQYRLKSKLYRSNIVLAPLGDDFRWDTRKEIDQQFTNYFKLIDYINSHPELRANVQFGTLADYFEAVRGASPPDRRNNLIPSGLPMLSGDFFTYADRADHYWSGYYTSRPFHKNMDRVMAAHLRTAEVLYSLVLSHDLPFDQWLNSVSTHLTDARRNLGLFQHHDGITGTAKDHVVIDYAKRVVNSVTACQNIIASSLRALVGKLSPDVAKEMTLEPNEKFELNKVPKQLIISLMEGSKVVSLINPLPQVARQLVTVVVNTPEVMVTNSSDTNVECQVSPVWVNGGVSVTGYRVTFPVTLPPLGWDHYTLSQQGGVACTRATIQLINTGPIQSRAFAQETVDSSQSDFSLSTPSLEAKFSGTNGLLKSITSGSSEVRTEVEFVMYGTTNKKDKSGAYLFMPGGEASGISKGTSPVFVAVGPLLQEVVTNVQSDLVIHTVQILNSPGVDGRSVSISNLVDIKKQSGNREVAMRVHTSVKNPSDTFYTDDNGYQMVKRQTYSKLPLQGNFYPMPTSALIQDANHRVTLFSGQPLGVASLKQGWLEVVLDRQLMQDDNRGLGQGVKDSVLTLEPFRLLVERRMGEASPTAKLVYHSLVGHATLDSLLHPLHAHTSPHTSHTLTPYTPLKQQLPCDFHLVNLRSLLDTVGDNAESALILHRRGFDCGFDVGSLSCSLVDGEVKLAEVFKTPPSSVSHTSLSMLHERGVLDSDSAYPVNIKPMEMHTYKLTW